MSTTDEGGIPDNVKYFDQLPDSALLNLADFAMLAGVAVKTVRGWIYGGKVQVVKRGTRCVRIPVSEARKHVGAAPVTHVVSPRAAAQSSSAAA